VTPESPRLHATGPDNRDAAHAYSVARLRRSAIVFVAAKGLTAPLNLLCFLLIAARLPKAEFALYAWLVAFGQLAQQLSFFGLNWIALHHVPYFRSCIGGRPYRRFLLGLVLVRAGCIVALVAACFVTAPYLVSAFGHEPWLQPLRLYLMVLSAEAGVEFLRSCVFEPLLEQGVSQGNVLVQHVVFLVGILLGLSAEGSMLSIEAVLYARAAAVWIALTTALGQFGYLLRQPATVTASERPLRWRALLAFALDNYAQDVTRLTSAGSLMTMLASRLVGVSELAVFGFAQHLAGFIHRLLPAQLFIGLLRPPVIAAYGRDRSFTGLRRRIGLILKISSCAFAAAVAVVIVVGRPGLALLAGGQYASSYGLLLTFLLWLTIVSLQRMQLVLANVLGHSELLRRASLCSMLVVPTAVLLVYAGAGPYGLVLGMVIGDALSVWTVARQFRLAGYRFAFDARGYGRMSGATLAAVVLGAMVVRALPAGLWSVSGGTATTVISFGLALRFLRPFTVAERRVIESLLGWKPALL
jgi:O-antigen/teichoic acid export membrane protein